MLFVIKCIAMIVHLYLHTLKYSTSDLWYLALDAYICNMTDKIKKLFHFHFSVEWIQPIKIVLLSIQFTSNGYGL